MDYDASVKDVDLEAAFASTSVALTIGAVGAEDHPLVFCNRAFTSLTGYEAAEAIGRDCRFLQGPDTDPVAAAAIRDAMAAGVSVRLEMLNYRKTGAPFWNDIRIDPIRDAQGVLIGYVGSQSDCTAMHDLRQSLLASEARLQSITSHVPGYIYRRVMAPDGMIDLPYLSPSICGFLGLAEGATVTAAQFYSQVHPDDLAGLIQAIRQSGAEMRVFREEFRMVATDGRVHWFRSDASPRKLRDGQVVWDGLAVDITAEKASVTELAYLSFHDSITGLSNRDLFKTLLANALASPSQADRPVGIFFIDLDGFQDINDAFGPTMGDEVLRAIGGRLTEFLGRDDGVVARLGGDEFAVMLRAISEARPIADIAAELCDHIARPIRLGDQDIQVQACVGAVAAPRVVVADQVSDPKGISDIMKQADVALHAAKRAGEGSHRVYTADLDDRLQNQMVLRQSLPNAISAGELRLHYQPLVDLGSGRIVGAEALVRWAHPEFGMIRPDLFIPLAESTGLIVPLGAWVIQEAMRQAQDWKRQRIAVPRIAINVSSVQLRKSGFVAIVEQALKITGANPRDFEFELTEGLLIEASPDILKILSALKTLGFGITIDDFGTGHATFKYLRDFPVDKLKIDQIFVRQLVIDSSDAFIIRAIVALSRSLGIEVLAEGIETEMQLDFLCAEGCALGQGYLFSMPLVPEDLGWMLQNKVVLPMSGRTV